MSASKDSLPELPPSDALMNAAFDYGAACHLSGRDGYGVPRQGSYAIKHAAEEQMRAYGLACYQAAREEIAAMRALVKSKLGAEVELL